MTERWRPVPGYEGLYTVSDRGRARSESRTVMRSNGRPQTCRERILSASPQPSGHLTVKLTRDGVNFSAKIHQLVLAAFVGPCPPGLETLHWDDDPANNALPNVRYGTRAENVLDAVRNGRNVNANKTHCVNGHEFTPENTARRARVDVARLITAVDGDNAAKNPISEGQQHDREHCRTSAQRCR